MPDENLLELRNLTKTFSRGIFRVDLVVAVDSVTFSIPQGKPMIFTLAGESGSGKTTTALSILRLVKPTSGEIVYSGRNIWRLNKKERLQYRREVQAIFQDPFAVFNPFYKIDHMLYMPTKKFKLAESKNEARELVCKSLEAVGLRPEEVLGKYSHQLSGGQRQRVMLARTFLTKSKLIVADEPVSMIDASLRAEILHQMIRIKENLHTSFLYITHDLSTAYYISDHIAIMYLGSIVERGPVEKVIDDPMHPYSKLLVQSIPIPDPDREWSDISLPEGTSKPSLLQGCKFYDRCPSRMERCLSKQPGEVEVEQDRMVACYLYESPGRSPNEK